MRHKYFEDQFDDEEMLFLFRKHPVVMRKGLVFSSVLLLVGPVYTVALTFMRPDNPPTIAYFFIMLFLSFILAMIFFFPTWMSWYFSVYALTDKRLLQIKQKGFFNKSLVDISNDQISMVNYEVNGLQETLLGFGTINIQTYVGELVIKNVSHPKKIHKELTSLLRSRGFLHGSGQPFMDAAESDQESIND